MTVAESVVTCDYCAAPRPAADLYEPYDGVRRCRDVPSCERRQLRAYDPTLPDARPSVPAPVSQGTCAICGASQPDGGLFERTRGVLICLNRPGCDARAVESLYLTAHADTSPDRLISPGQIRAMQAAAGAVIPAERPAPEPAELAAEA